MTAILSQLLLWTCMLVYICWGLLCFWDFFYVCFLLLQPANILVSPYPTSQCLFTVPGLIYGLLLLLLSDIVEYCRLWLPLQTPCHSIPCTVTEGPPWGPYIHSNWFGKDLAAFELKRDREESEDWGREMERRRKSKKRGERWRQCLCGWVCIFLAVLCPHPCCVKKTKKHEAIKVTY